MNKKRIFLVILVCYGVLQLTAFSISITYHDTVTDYEYRIENASSEKLDILVEKWWTDLNHFTLWANDVEIIKDRSVDWDDPVPLKIRNLVVNKNGDKMFDLLDFFTNGKKSEFVDVVQNSENEVIKKYFPFFSMRENARKTYEIKVR